MSMEVQADYAAHIGELDSNQRVLAAREMDRLALSMPNADEDEIEALAIRIAQNNIQTSKDAAERISEMRAGSVYCYLAFYGEDGRAMFMKVGISNHPEQRIYSIGTGNPLDCLWVYACPLPSRRAAYRVEQSLLRHLSALKRRGEWLNVRPGSKAEADAIASQFGEFAKALEQDAGSFEIVGRANGY